MPVRTDHPLLFRPDSFFIRPWRGWGVVVTPGGKTVMRFSATGEGRNDQRSAVVGQDLVFENGLTHRIEWEILSDDQDRYLATERGTGVQARGRVQGGNFCWSFRSRQPTPFGQRMVRTTVRYTMVATDKAFSFARTSWFGIPLADITTFYERRAEKPF